MTLNIMCMLQVEKYRYFDPETVGLDFEGMMEDIRSAPEGSVILLHGVFPMHRPHNSGSFPRVSCYPASTPA